MYKEKLKSMVEKLVPHQIEYMVGPNEVCIRFVNITEDVPAKALYELVINGPDTIFWTGTLQSCQEHLAALIIEGNIIKYVYDTATDEWKGKYEFGNTNAINEVYNYRS
jgi:hypothetical protein